MRSYQIRDEDGRALGYGCGPRPPTAGDIAVVREFAEELRVRKAELANHLADDPQGSAK